MFRNKPCEVRNKFYLSTLAISSVTRHLANLENQLNPLRCVQVFQIRNKKSKEFYKTVGNSSFFFRVFVRLFFRVLFKCVLSVHRSIRIKYINYRLYIYKRLRSKEISGNLQQPALQREWRRANRSMQTWVKFQGAQCKYDEWYEIYVMVIYDIPYVICSCYIEFHLLTSVFKCSSNQISQLSVSNLISLAMFLL